MKKIWEITLLLLLPAVAWPQKVEINRVHPRQVEVRAFTLGQDATVDVKGTVAVFTDSWRTLVFYGWIINSETREVVWHWFDEEGIRRDRRRNRYRHRRQQGLIDVKAQFELKKGNYELYFAGGSVNRNDWDSHSVSINGLGDLIRHTVLASRRRKKYRDRYLDDLYLSVESPSLKAANPDEVINGVLERAIVSFNKVRKFEDLKKGFTLTKETRLDIYAVGEGRRDQVFDYVWIYNAATREMVFQMDYRNTRHAGGADKNRSLRQTIKLPIGSYLVSYVTDDSHSYGDWNALPPDDPEFWGVTIWPATMEDKANVTEYVQPKTATPLVDLTKIGDDEFVNQGIKVKSDLEVHVLCLGEQGSRGEMLDYGWIIDANTREKIWKMDAGNARHAGGANKNRMVDEKITLKAGDYLVYYATDDSHSYRGWNAPRPHEGDLWGISLWATHEEDISKVEAFNGEDFKSTNIIAEIIMVGNDKYLRENFELTEDTRVTIVGMGEGDNDQMYDFGYVKNMDNGEIVFQMRYRYSDHAGGVRKNREVSKTMTLKKGNYQMVYQSDDSHAYRRWNASPPRNPELWGITVMKN